MGFCGEKHTLYQPTEEEWKCPRCGEVEDFVIDNGDLSYMDDDCVLLHEKDAITCGVCGKFVSGKTFAKNLQKAKNLVTCPCCKGKGLIDGKVES